MSDAVYILPGDHIDILVQSTQRARSGLRYTFQDIIVLRVGSLRQRRRRASPDVLLVEVPRAEAPLLTGLVDR